MALRRNEPGEGARRARRGAARWALTASVLATAHAGAPGCAPVAGDGDAADVATGDGAMARRRDAMLPCCESLPDATVGAPDGAPDAAQDAPPADRPRSRRRFRVAHFAHGTGPIDVCYRASNQLEPYLGPLLLGAGATAGLAFGQVTQWIEMPDTALSVHAIPVGSTDCEGSIGRSGTTITSVADRSTVAFVGVAGSGETERLMFYPFEEPVDPPTATGVALAFGNVAPPPTPVLDVAVQVGSAFETIFDGVAYRRAGGFAPLVRAPFAGARVQLRETGMDGAVVLDVGGVDAPGGATRSLYAIGRVGVASGPTALALLVCNPFAAPVAPSASAVGVDTTSCVRYGP